MCCLKVLDFNSASIQSILGNACHHLDINIRWMIIFDMHNYPRFNLLNLTCFCWWDNYLLFINIEMITSSPLMPVCIFAHYWFGHWNVLICHGKTTMKGGFIYNTVSVSCMNIHQVCNLKFPFWKWSYKTEVLSF